VDRLRVAALTGAIMTQLADVARLFDQYRQHYGEPAARCCRPSARPLHQDRT
jgi:hypothetical protein